MTGHSDIKTAMRYIHNDIMKKTASLKWSRADRLKAQKLEDKLDRSPDSQFIWGDDEATDDNVGIKKVSHWLVPVRIRDKKEPVLLV